MPLLNKKEFVAEDCPPNLKPDDLVFYLPTTREVFTTYDGFFQRQITLNSMVWTCAATGRSGLTFEEAAESEKNAQETLETFPDSFGVPILYLVQNLCFRGRIDDLLNDVYLFIRDRYFVGEECTYTGDRRKKSVRILNVSFSGENFCSTSGDGHNGTPKNLPSSGKRGELRVGPPESYAYTVQIVDDAGNEDDDGVREGVTHKHLSRSKAVSSRAKLKLFLKNSCVTDAERQHVKDFLVAEYNLSNMPWNSVFGGPVAEFPRTPLLHRGHPKGTPRSTRHQPNDDGAACSSSEILENGIHKEEERTKEKDKEKERVVEKEKEKDGPPSGKKRGRPKGSFGSEKKSAIAAAEKAHKETKAKTPSKAEKAKMAKKRKEIEKQQEELQIVFQQARRAGVSDISRWEQEERLLSPDDINDLKQAIRLAKEHERELAREAKQRERELFAEWKKPRDDTACDDLKPLPDFEDLRLPTWISEDEFGDLLFIYQFFQTFAEILPIKEVCGATKISFVDVVKAVRSVDPQGSAFVELMHVLLLAKAERVDEEEGDEANLNNKEELSLDPGNDLDNKVYGERIRQVTTFHENVRLTHGVSARHLPINWMTISEVLRLSLLSSGYYTATGTHRFRLFSRGGPRFFEDEGFLFANNNPSTMLALEKGSVFELEPRERAALFRVLIQQLNSYSKFRIFAEEKLTNVAELRRELKAFRMWDAAQEKDAREAKLIREYEAEQIEEHGEAARVDLPKRVKPSRETNTLVNHLRLLRDGTASRRDDKLLEIQKIVLDGIAFMEMEVEEIEEAHLFRKEYVVARESEILSRIYDLQAQAGLNHLGRDRTFRSYWFLDSLSLLLVERPVSEDEIGVCSDATPLDKVENAIRRSCANDDALRRLLLGCTLSEDCPVHGRSGQRRWQYVQSVETLDSLLSACNARGFREMELAECLTFFKPNLYDLLRRTAKKVSSGELWKDLLVDECDPSVASSTVDWAHEMVEMLLDLEEKMEQGGIGHLSVGDEGVDRDEWRRLLQETQNVSSFVRGDVEVFDDVVITYSEVGAMEPVGQLALAFLHIVQGVNVNFLRLPFATSSTKEATSIPTTIFAHWQKSLLKCSSMSALALFYNTLEGSILWNKSRLQAKCRNCRRRGVVENLVLCEDCNRCYHIDCVRPKLSKVCENWKCADCVAIQKAKEAEERRAKRKVIVTRESDDEDVDDEEEEESGGSTSLFDDEMSSADSRSRETPPNMQKTTSGRIVKKVIYTEDLMANGVRKRERRSLRNRRGASAGSETDRSNDPEVPSRKRTRFGGERERKLKFSRNLRESDHQSRDALRELEGVVRDAMKQQFSWPFVDPVDARYVPDYHQIIKRPMDLRTMMNKLKQRLYDKPDQVVADARLMFDNCRIYNEEGSEIYQCADKLEQFMDEKFDQLLHKNGRSNGDIRPSRR